MRRLDSKMWHVEQLRLQFDRCAILWNPKQNFDCMHFCEFPFSVLKIAMPPFRNCNRIDGRLPWTQLTIFHEIKRNHIEVYNTKCKYRIYLKN